MKKHKETQFGYDVSWQNWMQGAGSLKQATIRTHFLQSGSTSGLDSFQMYWKDTRPMLRIKWPFTIMRKPSPGWGQFGTVWLPPNSKLTQGSSQLTLPPATVCARALYTWSSGLKLTGCLAREPWVDDLQWERASAALM